MTMQNPMGLGLQYAQGLSGLESQAVNRDVSQRSMGLQEQMYADQIAQQQAQAQASAELEGLKQAYAQDPSSANFAALALKDTELANKLRSTLGLDNETRNTQVFNQAFGLKQMLRNNPEQAFQYWQENNLNADPAFKGLADNFMSKDYEGAIKELEMGASLLGQERFNQIIDQPDSTELIETGEGYAVYNAKQGTLNTIEGAPMTMDQVKNVEAQRAAQLKTELDTLDTNIKRADKLREEVTKRSKELGIDQTFAAYNRILATNDGTAAGDIALIFNYMKMLDPGSVVREGEFATAQNAGGIDENIRNTYNKLISGERLNPEQRAMFTKTSGDIYEKATQSFEQVVQPILNLGAQSNLTQDQILGKGYFESFQVDDSGVTTTVATEQEVSQNQNPAFVAEEVTTQTGFTPEQSQLSDDDFIDSL